MRFGESVVAEVERRLSGFTANEQTRTANLSCIERRCQAILHPAFNATGKCGVKRIVGKPFFIERVWCDGNGRAFTGQLVSQDL